MTVMLMNKGREDGRTQKRLLQERERETKCGNRKGTRRNEGVRIMFFLSSVFLLN